MRFTGCIEGRRLSLNLRYQHLYYHYLVILNNKNRFTINFTFYPKYSADRMF